MKLLLAALLMATPLPAASAPDYKYCEITGLAFGAGKDFIASVASRIADRQGLNGTPGCQAVWQDAFNDGKRLSAAGGLATDIDFVKWQKLQDFEERVIDALIENLNLEEG